ncbi:hypothetical protein SP60_04260 [Candidatus Thioglobus autotrophicus]|uniref:Uncharacterized protein n=1 Tax=Candidatus Thioglobus autotrophicus TaxID=1705394 RepID=A0A0M4P8Z9_9GAMM|nr:hypothetical protein [Candidatus Thioglobus autotrophicus]ALE52497.1 hypothetical protein SP60_04260 [Candidatus Thioglobus autotrophicus]WPE18068.1 hypothetical protein R5P05_00255 [Candidatus Thioglobus autotrophicus]
MNKFKLIASLTVLLPTLASALTTITVHRNDNTQSTCSKICPTVEGCIGKAMEFDRNGGNNGRYKHIVVKHNGRVIMMRDYSSVKNFNNVEGFYK